MPSSKASRKKQARLSFTPLPSSSPAAKDYHTQIRDRAAAVTLEGTPRSSKYRKVHDDDSDLEVLQNDEEAAIPTPDASLQKQKAEVVEIDSDDEPIRPTQRSKAKARVKSRARQQRLDFSDSRDADTFDSPVKLPSSSVLTRSSRPGMFSSQINGQAIDSSSDDLAESDELPSPRKQMEKSKKSRKGKHGRDAVVEDDDSEDEIAVARRRAPQAPQESEEDDEEDMPTTAGKKPRRWKAASPDSFISDSPPPAPDSDDEIAVTVHRSKKRARQETESEDDEDDIPKTPGRRRLKRPRQMTQQEQEDLADDLDFLQPSSGEEEGVKPRGTQSAQKNARQQALEKLKRMRSCQLPQVEEDEQDEGDAEEQEQEEPYDDEEDEEVVPEVVRARQMFTKNDDDDDFLEQEEDEGSLGVPEGVPLEFTRYASMKSKELFEYAVEWMVQKKINPAFRMNDPIYELTFKKLDDEVRGLAASKFTSSAWKADFTFALQARPDIAYDKIDRNSAEHWMRDKCDACNRSGHPATYQIQFQGKPYNRDTLDPVSPDDEDDDDSDSSSSEGENDEEPDWDASGREIAPTSTIWYVGKFCKGNAETAHGLSHWKHHLNGYVESYLEGHQYCTAAQLVKRDKWNTKKRSKYANKVVDRMKAEGEVKNLWKLFKDNIDQARNSKQGRYVGDSD